MSLTPTSLDKLISLNIIFLIYKIDMLEYPCRVIWRINEIYVGTSKPTKDSDTLVTGMFLV